MNQRKEREWDKNRKEKGRWNIKKGKKKQQKEEKSAWWVSMKRLLFANRGKQSH